MLNHPINIPIPIPNSLLSPTSPASSSSCHPSASTNISSLPPLSANSLSGTQAPSIPAPAPPSAPPSAPAPAPASAPNHIDYTHPLGITPQLTQSTPETTTLPTVLITYKHPTSLQIRSVKARIDRNVPLEEVIRQLCTSAQLAVNQPSLNFSLRDASNNELITHDNVFRKIESGQGTFRLVKSPKVEAQEIVERLKSDSSVDHKSIKLSLFSLKDYLRESEFSNEFQNRGGDQELLRLVQISTGNTLAYTLSALQVLIDQTSSDQRLEWQPVLADRLASLLVSSAPINVLRPTSAILRKMLIHEPVSGPRTAFRAMCGVIEAAAGGEAEDVLGLLGRRIGSGSTSDVSLAQGSLALVNGLMRAALSEDGSESVCWLADLLERAGLRRAVLRLGEGRAEEAGDEVEADVLAFQKHIVHFNRRLIRTPVNAEDNDHVAQLMEMAARARELDERANAARVDDDDRAGEEELEARKWKTLGFDSANLLDDFEKVGVLGLRLMYRFMTNHVAEFDKFIAEQLVKPDGKRCPFAKASNKCAEILAEIYEWNTSDAQPDQQMTVYRPFMLNYPKLHNLSLDFFKLMWNESGATTHDFERVGVLVRSQLKNALRIHENNGKRSFKVGWNLLVKEFENVEYMKVRDRQMQELALEDSMWNKPPVRNLRGKLYQDAFEFIKTQRIQTLLIGAWFPHQRETLAPTVPQSSKLGLNVASLRSHQLLSLGGGGSKNGSSHGGQPEPTRWRFYRLAPNRKYLHYLEAGHPGPVRNGVEDMPDRIEVGLITEIVSGSGGATGAAYEGGQEGTEQPVNQPMNRRFSSFSSTSTADSLSMLGPTAAGGGGLGGVGVRGLGGSMSISLMSGDHLLVRLLPPNTHIHSEWLDGLNMVKTGAEGGAMTTKESAELVYGLTQIGAMIKLLDLSGERVEVPSHLNVPPVPVNVDFFYASDGNPTC